MLHDGALARSRGTSNGNERRAHSRVASPAEVVVRWHQEPGGSVRYSVVDTGEGGMRVRSSMPMLTGMTCTVVTLLPEGRRLDRAAMVVWCRAAPEGDGHHLGLRYLDPV